MPYGLLLALLALAAAAAGIASLLVGPSSVGMADLLAWLRGAWPGGTDDPAARLILAEVRLPRAILGLAIGAILGLSGAALQGFLRNPLAEPGLIGVSASAALGAVLVFYFGLAGLAFAVPLAGMAGAICAVVLVQLLAGRESGSMALILAGIAVTSFAGAMTSLALSLAPSPFAAFEIVFWLLGSLADRSMSHVTLALPFMVAGAVMLLALGRSLDGLSLGEDAARSLGINLRLSRNLLVVGTALGVGAATSVAGVIGFVGLVVPHLLRPLVGGLPGRLLPASALGGAALTALADVATRVLGGGSELKLGVVTALVGAPFFFALVLRERRRLV
ncbi:MAG: iron ABC transporter permease [Alphaproteobacteria bacterium]